MTLHPSRALALAAVASVLATFPAVADGIGPWADGERASARLIVASSGPDGRVDAGLEIVLPPGWKTYWRNPGDAGIEPRFDFAPSQNVAEVRVAFPTPEREDDGYAVSNVYHDRVLFPLDVTVADPDAPARLVGDLRFGVCEVVCVADRVVVEVDLGSGGATRAIRILEKARATLPGEAVAGEFAVTGVRRDGGTDKRPVYVFRTVSPAGGATDVFVDGPDGWYPALPVLESEDGQAADWRVKFARSGSDVGPENPAFTVVLSADGRAIQQDVSLDKPGL